jgi:hypothetical protein
MNSHSSYRWLFVLVTQVSLIGCSTPVVSGEMPDAASEDEFWRTTFCVAGKLPMEVQFSLADNPVRLEGDRFGLSEVDRIIEQLDIRVAALLKDSATAAWQQTYGNQATKWSSQLTNELADALVVEIAARAPKSLGIGFCGSSEQVGNAAYAAIFGYFSRAVQLEGGRWPGWLDEAQARSHGGIVVMLAVALRLAQIEFDTEKLVQSLAE